MPITDAADSLGGRLERIRALMAHFIQAPADSVESQHVVARIFKEIDLARQQILAIEGRRTRSASLPEESEAGN